MKGVWGAALVLTFSALLIGSGILLFGLENRVKPPEDDWFVLVRSPGRDDLKIGMEELRGLCNITVEMALLGTGEDGRTHTYTGLPVRDLARQAGIAAYTKVTVRAADTYSKLLTRDQVMEHDVLLAVKKDGKDLAPRSAGGTGPVRLVISQEAVGTYNAQHCVKWVSEVVFE